jgi:hypothetical protein
VGLEIGGPITPALALSASVEISARRLLQAGFSRRSRTRSAVEDVFAIGVNGWGP